MNLFFKDNLSGLFSSLVVYDQAKLIGLFQAAQNSVAEQFKWSLNILNLYCLT